MKILFLILISSLSNAASIKDFKPFQYEVLFTNPICDEYKYSTPQTSNNGTILIAKPKNVYCKSQDTTASGARPTSPEYRLVQWIESAHTKEIFLAYLSFSNKRIAEALCKVVKKGVKLSMVLDAKPEEEEKGNNYAEDLKNCGNVQVHYRGNRNGLGFAHDKILMINPQDAHSVSLVFSSGNMSTGTVIHHENWNFITTSAKSHFVQAHLCLKEGLINHGESRKEFVAFMDQCRNEIKTPEESDLKTFFVPGEGKKAFEAISSLANQSKSIKAMAHRFSGIFISLFDQLAKNNKDVKLILDDDMYWSFKLHKDIGRNTRMEAFKVMPLEKSGVQLRYLETNQTQVLLQHNKYMIFDLHNGSSAVFTGAGNFTSSAFDNNFENFYVITIPEVVAKFQNQYQMMWNDYSTTYQMMPTSPVMP